MPQDESDTQYRLVSKFGIETSRWFRLGEFESSGLGLVLKSFEIIVINEKLQDSATIPFS